MKTVCYKCHKALGSISSYGLHPECFQEWFGLEPGVKFAHLQRQETDSERESQVFWNFSFFQGKFRKYSGVLGKNEYILKVKDERYPELPYVEYVCNQIAQELKIEIPRFFLISLYNEPTFVSRYFLSRSSSSQLVHIYHYLKENEEFNCENLLRIIIDQTNSYREANRFVKLCLFDSLIGNHDRHGRNLALLVTPGKTVLSPTYDNTSALGLEQGSILQAAFDPRGKIYCRDSQEPSLNHYVKELIRLGYAESVDEFRCSVRMSRLEDIINAGFYSKLMRQALNRLVFSRYQELTNV